MFDQLSFKRKISLLVVSSIAALIVVTGISLFQTSDDITEGRKTSLRTAVQSAYNIVASYQAAVAAGALSEEEAKKAATDAVRLARYGGSDGKTDYFYILTTDGVGVMHPLIKTWADHKQLTGTKNAQGVDTAKTVIDAIAASNTGSAYLASAVARPGDKDPNAKLYPKLQYMMTVPGWNWIVGSGLYTDDVDEQVRTAAFKQLGVCLAVLAAISGLGFLVTRSVLRQLGGEPSVAIAAMSEVANGNLAFDVPAAPAGSVIDGLRSMVNAVRSTLVQVRAATDSINTASVEIATGNQDLSARTEQTASNLQQVASSMVQLTGTVQQSADSARHANQLASSAAEVAQRGGAVVSQVVSTMHEINASSKKIADIISVIDAIAFQTNILSLNAAVEAARAGEQGRGFAVVASEVRSLAQRSAEAAKEIKSLIETSVDRVEIGSSLVADAGATMNEIVASVQRVSDIIGEITTASSEQSDGIGQINSAVAQLDEMTQQNAALVEESAAAAESLKDQAERLANAVAVFRLGGADTAGTQAPTTKSHTSMKAPAVKPAPALRAAQAPIALPAANGSGDWESF